MSTRYKANDINSAYFITITTVGWIDVFTRLEQKQVIIDSLKYCQQYKGLEIYAYVLMHSHLHLLCRSNSNVTIAEIMRDFKKFTSKKIIQTIYEEQESRRDWMLNYFYNACNHLNRKQTFKVWQDGYHAEEVYSNSFIQQKINYIHMNPVKDKVVLNPEDYYYSSARNYSGLEYDLEVIVLFFA